MALALAAMVAMAMVPAAHASAPTPHYARAIACAAGDATLAAMLGGEAAQGDDRNTVARLNTLSARWLELALAEAGAGLRHVVRTRTFVTNIDQWEAVSRAHGERFRDVRPAATMVEVSRLIAPGLLVEIEVDAVIHDAASPTSQPST